MTFATHSVDKGYILFAPYENKFIKVKRWYKHTLFTNSINPTIQDAECSVS